MDGQNITTSFIPKTKFAEPVYRRKGLSIGLLISGLIFLISLGLWGGLYLYKQSLQKSVDEDIASLEIAAKSLESGLIDDVSLLAFLIDTAKDLFSQHEAVSKIFKIISDLTLKDVRFLNFSFNMSGTNPSVSLTGEAKDYSGVALQARLFGQSDAVSQTIVSNFGLKEAGKVGFGVNIILKSLPLIYKP